MEKGTLADKLVATRQAWLEARAQTDGLVREMELLKEKVCRLETELEKSYKAEETAKEELERVTAEFDRIFGGM